MSDLEETDLSIKLNEKKKITFTLLRNFIETRIDEVKITSDFSNADLLIMLDDLMDTLKMILEQQIKQIQGEVEDYQNLQFCINKTISSIDHMVDIKKEKLAKLLTKKSFLPDIAVQKTLLLMEKEFKSVISNSMFQLEKCVN